jgi:hypothetical protein
MTRRGQPRTSTLIYSIALFLSGAFVLVILLFGGGEDGCGYPGHSVQSHLLVAMFWGSPGIGAVLVGFAVRRSGRRWLVVLCCSVVFVLALFVVEVFAGLLYYGSHHCFE